MNNPLAYFENLLSSDLSLQKKRKMISDYLQLVGENHEADIDYENGIIKEKRYFYNESTDCIQESFGVLTFHNSFNKEIKYEQKNSQETIAENLFIISSQANNSIHEYLSYLVDRLKFLADKSVKLYPEYEFVYEALRNIIIYIKENYIELCKNIDFIGVLAFIEINKVYTFSSEQETIISIIGYLKSNNSSREKILSDEDFEYLLIKLDELLETNRLPEIPRKIESVNISKNLLSYTFWVLHKYLYGTKSIKPYFLQFIQSIFSCYDDWSSETFRKKFGNKDKITYGGEKFIPRIIIDELKS